MDPNIAVLTVFIFTYVLFIVFPRRRTLAAVSAGLLLLASRMVSPREAFISINWNVMGIFVGTLIVADVFMESRAPALIAAYIVNRMKSVTGAILSICLLTGFISAFVENVATVLIVAPIALSLAKRLKINPVNIMIAIAISSNLQGAATLIGDPPSMLLGGFARMDFGDFFFYRGRPSIFFAVELGALASFGFLYFIFRKHKENIPIEESEKVKSWIPVIILVALISALGLSSFFDTGFSYMAGTISMAFGIISIFWKGFAIKSPVIEGVKSLDWDTTFFLAGIFILVGSITGWIDKLSSSLSGIIGQNIFLGYTLIVIISVFLSAFVDNVPFLAAMLPVAISMSDKLHREPELFLFGMLIGASLGGNITPIGASSNIVACGLLRKEGYEIKFRDFVKIGLPFTAFAVSAAYVFTWFIWK